MVFNFYILGREGGRYSFFYSVELSKILGVKFGLGEIWESKLRRRRRPPPMKGFGVNLRRRRRLWEENMECHRRPWKGEFGGATGGLQGIGLNKVMM